MLEALGDLGFLDADRGELSPEEEIFLLHIYKSKLEEQPIELAQTQAKIASGELKEYTQLLDKNVANFFDGNFNSGIEKLHAYLVQKKAENKAAFSLKTSRMLSDGWSSLTQKKREISETRKNLKVMKNWLNGDAGFEALCAARGMSSDAAKAVLTNQYNKQLSQFLTDLNSSVGYLITEDVQMGRYQKDATLAS